MLDVWHANGVRSIERPSSAEGAMAKEITHYSRKLRREAEEGRITRYIVVKESGGGFLVSVNDVTPTESNEHNTSGHTRDLVKMDWFSTAEQSIEMAETAFQSSLDSGFYEDHADWTDEGYRK
jgi:hypothetical protein